MTDDLADLIAELSRPRSCRDCGALYGDAASFAVHRDGSGCLGGDAHGQLVLVDGAAWFRRGTEPTL